MIIATTKLQWICCFVLCTLGLWNCHEPYLQKSKVVGAKVCKFKVGLNLSYNPKNAAEDLIAEIITTKYLSWKNPENNG